MKRSRLWLFGAALGVLALLMFTQRLQEILVDPDVVLLAPGREGATWIRVANPDSPGTYGAAGFRAAFRKRFRVDSIPRKALLRIQPFRWVRIYLDGELIGGTIGSAVDQDQWKDGYAFNLSRYLDGPGEHELMLSVRNRSGPPMVLASCFALGLASDETWQAKNDQTGGWVPATPLRAPEINSVGPQLPPPSEALGRVLPLLVAVFLFVSAWAFAAERRIGPGLLQRLTPSASGVRWVILSAWAVLAINNVTEVPYGIGFDVHGHYEYMLYLIRNWRVPVAPDGWAMFQAPFYYLVSAPLYVLFSALFTPVKVVEALRVVPLLCGALQVQLCYLALREVFPKREDLQILGTVLGGLLPMNLYISQNLSNEPLAGALSSAAIVVALRLQRDPERRWRASVFVVLGTLLGLAMLTKATALLLTPALVLTVGYAARRRVSSTEQAIGPAAAGLATLFATAFVFSGWYYVRNWILLGQPFVGGWDKVRGYEWWQEPGYRTFDQFTSFGRVFSEPAYSALYGLWDGIYSTLWLDGFLGSQVEPINFPPWNMDFMLSSVWLSLVPTAALLVGALAIAVRPRRSLASGELFGLICLGLYYAATFYLVLLIPSFSTIKATYTMGILPCYAIVAAAGFDLGTRTAPGRALLFGFMGAWGLAAYAAYFVVS